jgi:hypothetical protein
MTPEELVAAASPKIGAMGSAFYFVPETAARGKELGLDAFRFYFLGRGGVLGDVEAPVVASAFGYFNPDLVAKMWSSAKAVLPPREAGRVYFQACADLGRRRFADLAGLGAFCAAAGAVNAAADPVGLPLYAGIRAEPLADDEPGRAMQLVSVLRELRGSAHLLAVRAAGVEPRTAHFASRPDDGAMFGWAEDQTPAVTEADRAAMVEAEAITDRIVTPAYAALDDDGARALLTGLHAMEAALAG